MNTPEMIPGTTENVSVEWLLQNLVGFVDIDPSEADWVEMMENKAYDRSTAMLAMRALAEGFTVPVCLYESWACGYGEPIGWALGNGHHRLTVAILLCADSMPVYWSENDDYMQEQHTTGGGQRGYCGDDDWWMESMTEEETALFALIHKERLFV